LKNFSTSAEGEALAWESADTPIDSLRTQVWCKLLTGEKASRCWWRTEEAWPGRPPAQRRGGVR